MAAIDIAVVNVTLPDDGGGTVDAVVPGFGTPTAAIVYGIISNGGSGNLGDHYCGTGFASLSGSIRQRATAGRDTNNSSTVNCSRGYDWDGCLISIDGNGSATENEFFISDVITDGIRITERKSSALGSGRSAYVVLLKNCSAYVSVFDLGATDSVITAPGFEPDLVYFMSAHTSLTATPGYYRSFGVAVNKPVIKQRGGAGHITDAQGNAYLRSVGRNSNYVIQRISNASGFEWGASVTAFSSTGFTVSPSSDAGGDRIAYLAIKADDPDPLIDLVDVDYTGGQPAVHDGVTDFRPSFVNIFGFNASTNISGVVGGGGDIQETHCWIHGGPPRRNSNDTAWLGRAFSICHSVQYNVEPTAARSGCNRDGLVMYLDDTTEVNLKDPQFTNTGWRWDQTTVAPPNDFGQIGVVFGKPEKQPDPYKYSVPKRGVFAPAMLMPRAALTPNSSVGLDWDAIRQDGEVGPYADYLVEVIVCPVPYSLVGKYPFPWTKFYPTPNGLSGQNVAEKVPLYEGVSAGQWQEGSLAIGGRFRGAATDWGSSFDVTNTNRDGWTNIESVQLGEFGSYNATSKAVTSVHNSSSKTGYTVPNLAGKDQLLKVGWDHRTGVVPNGAHIYYIEEDYWRGAWAAGSSDGFSEDYAALGIAHENGDLTIRFVAVFLGVQIPAEVVIAFDRNLNKFLRPV